MLPPVARRDKFELLGRDIGRVQLDLAILGERCNLQQSGSHLLWVFTLG